MSCCIFTCSLYQYHQCQWERKRNVNLSLNLCLSQSIRRVWVPILALAKLPHPPPLLPSLSSWSTAVPQHGRIEGAISLSLLYHFALFDWGKAHSPIDVQASMPYTDYNNDVIMSQWRNLGLSSLSGCCSVCAHLQKDQDMSVCKSS